MIFEKVREIIADQMTIDKNSITPETLFVDNLGADSLDILKLVTELEEIYKIEFEPSELEKMKTVSDAVEYIKKATAQN